jgi:lysophospholipase L1-like esterase
MKLLRRTLAMMAVLITGIALATTPAAAAPTPPNSMASLGDSITRGFDACGWFEDCPEMSWSTGTDAGVNSQYLRIRAVNPAINVHNYNDAVTGARSSDMYDQAGTAISQNVQYVTMLIGGNDACTSSALTMTPVSTFRAHIDSALGRLKAGLPNAYVQVVSIPDVYRLWLVGQRSSAAVLVWSVGNICQSLLENATSNSPIDESRRQRVRQRVIDYNTQLAQACAAYGASCKFDNNAVFNYRFVLDQISSWDYFHPNTTGQNVVASLTYANGFGW